MNRPINTTRPWGIALILTGVLFVLAGLFGARWGASTHDKVLQQREREDRAAKAETRDVHEENLRKALEGESAIALQTERISAAGPVLILSNSIDSLFQVTVDNAVRDMDEAFPAGKHVVTATIRIGEPSVQSEEILKWSATTPGVPNRVVENPRGQGFSYSGGATIEPLHLWTPASLSGDYYGKEVGTIQQFYSDHVINSYDVAGNVIPIGVKGFASLGFYSERDEEPRTFYALLSLLAQRLSQLGLLLLIITPPVWVYLDARSKRLPAVLWGMFALITSFLGALIYSLVTREAGPLCPECGERISARFVVCPYCQTELKGTCPTCGQTIGSNWHYCPSCSTEL